MINCTLICCNNYCHRNPKNDGHNGSDTTTLTKFVGKSINKWIFNDLGQGVKFLVIKNLRYVIRRLYAKYTWFFSDFKATFYLLSSTVDNHPYSHIPSFSTSTQKSLCNLSYDYLNIRYSVYNYISTKMLLILN